MADETESVDQETPEIEEVEVVLETEEASPSDSVPMGAFKRRVGKLTQRVQDRDQQIAERDRELEQLRQERDLLLQSTRKRPTPEDFDSDAAYQAALDDFQADRTKRIVEEAVAKVQPAAAPEPNLTQNDAIDAHYARAEKLKVSDYEACEDRAIEILGQSFVREIIAASDEGSELVMYYLGKNPGKAQEIADMFQSNPVRAVREIGRLEAKLQPKPKKMSQPAPETQVEGGTPGGATNRLEMLREKAAKTGDMSELMAYKREQRQRAS